MAEAASRASGNTVLYVGTLAVNVGLFGTQAKLAKEAEFDTAGPHGGVLRHQQRAAEKPIEEQVEAPVPVTSDPLAGIADFTAPTGTSDAVASVEGEFRQVLVEDGYPDHTVEPHELRKGVRLEGGEFIDCTDQLAAIVERTKLDRMDVVATVDSTTIRRREVIGAYYIGAQDEKAPPVLRLLFEALAQERRAAVVKFTTRSRQQLGVIVPDTRTGTLMLMSLVFHEDYRDAPAKAKVIQNAQVTEAQVDVMRQIVKSLNDTPDVFDTLRDDAIALREELRARALAGEMSAEVVEPLPEPATAEELDEVLSGALANVRAGKV